MSGDMTKYRVLDLFSGIGGFAIGLEAAGMETVAFCEVAKAPRYLLATHWPEVPCYDDVKTLTAERLAADGIGVDVLCGGFPCQDLSYAGKGAGLAGERSGLWFQIARILRELRDVGRPVRIVILENVSALLGRGLGVVLGDLASLGYDAEWDCIPASAVGAPHRRDRIWIVAYARGLKHEGFGDAFRRSLAEELSRAAVANANGRLHEGGLVSGATDGTPSRGQSGDTGERQTPHRERFWPELGASGSYVADTDGDGWPARQQAAQTVGRGHLPASGDSDVGYANGAGLSVSRVSGGPRSTPSIIQAWRAANGAGWWATEPDVGRVAHGVPARVDRLHGLGNAVVPQIPEILGRAIIAAEAQCLRAAA